MSDDKLDSSNVSIEGWSFVRHKDDVGSDGDSVEVITDESDRDTCDEGKDVCDEEQETEPADCTTEPAPDLDEDDVGPIHEDDIGSDLVRLDPMGDLTRRFFDKLHGVLVSRHPQNDHNYQEMKLRYMIVASTLLALICSLLVSSYLLFHKFQELSKILDDSSKIFDDSSTTQVRHKLEQAIYELQSVLLENEQNLKNIHVKTPPDCTKPEMVSRDGMNTRRPLKRSQAVPTDMKDFSVFMTIEQMGEMASRLLEKTAKKAADDEKLVLLGGEPRQKNTEVKSDVTSKLQLEERVRSIKKPSDGPLDSNQPLNADSPASGQEFNDDFIEVNPDPKISLKGAQDILLSVRQDISSIQNELYSQITNSLFEYKIDLYKNLMRAGIDSTCNADHSSKKSNHKKFMMIRHLQNIISKSSESNFESWYTFYSHVMSPKFRKILSKLDSITNVEASEHKDFVDEITPSATSDDFFVRSSVSYDDRAKSATSGGFDWKNLDKKIRESMKKGRKMGDEVSKNLEVAAGELKSSDGKLPYENDLEMSYVETGKIGDTKVYESGKADGESMSRSDIPQKEERKKARGVSEDMEHEQPKSNSKPTSKRDTTHDNKKNFDKQSGVGSEDFDEKNEKFERRERMSEGAKERFDKEYCSGARCGKSHGKHYYFHNGKSRRKSFLNNMTKYVKKAASGLWKTVKGGFKKVKNYGSFIKDWHTGKDKGSGNYEEWRREFLKEMRDVVRVLGGNPAINGLYELPKSMTRFFGDGLGNLMNIDEMDEEGVRECEDGEKMGECKPSMSGDKCGNGMCSSDESSSGESDSDGTADEDDSWLAEDNKNRVKSRVDSRPISPDSSWFLGLGRHRSYLRRRGIHLNNDGSWFISSARHRASMRQRHIDSPQFPPHFTQASTKR